MKSEFNLESFNQKQKSILQSLLARPITDTSFISPNNFFRIHYNTSGTETPTYNLQLFADALDSVYNFEVNIFGYPPPLQTMVPGVIINMISIL